MPKSVTAAEIAIAVETRETVISVCILAELCKSDTLLRMAVPLSAKLGQVYWGKGSQLLDLRSDSFVMLMPTMTVLNDDKERLSATPGNHFHIWTANIFLLLDMHFAFPCAILNISNDLPEWSVDPYLSAEISTWKATGIYD